MTARVETSKARAATVETGKTVTAKEGTSAAEGGRAAKKTTGKADKPKAKAKDTKSKGKAAKPKTDKAAAGGPANPQASANGVTRGAAAAPAAGSDDVLSRLVR